MRCVCLSSVMDIRVLGPLEVYADGTDVTPTSPNQRTVLAVLAAHPDRHVRADTLIDALWGPDPPPSADRTLRSYVSRLRAVVGRLYRSGPRWILLAHQRDSA
jgi:DNA-binding SARP family transcriptional activator